MFDFIVAFYCLYVLGLVFISYRQVVFITKVKTCLFNNVSFENEGIWLQKVEKLHMFWRVTRGFILVGFTVFIFENKVYFFQDIAACLLLLFFTLLIENISTMIYLRYKKITYKRVHKYLPFVLQEMLFNFIVISFFPIIILSLKLRKGKQFKRSCKLNLTEIVTDPLAQKKLSKEDIVFYKTKNKKRPAYTIKREGLVEIYLGEKLLKILTEKELLSVIYHELGHFKQNRLVLPLVLIVYSLVIISIINILIQSTMDFRPLLILLTLFVFTVRILFNVLKQREELKADLYSREKLESNIFFINALTKGYIAYKRYPYGTWLFNKMYQRHPLVKNRKY